MANLSNAQQQYVHLDRLEALERFQRHLLKEQQLHTGLPDLPQTPRSRAKDILHILHPPKISHRTKSA